MMISMLFFTDHGATLKFYDCLMEYMEYSDIFLFILL